MRNRRFKYDETYPCCCIGGRLSCGVIGINDFDIGGVEIGFATRKERYQGNTKNPHINLDREQIVKLIAFLQKNLDNYDKILGDKK